MERHVLHGSGKIHRCLFGGCLWMERHVLHGSGNMDRVLKTLTGGERLVFEKDKCTEVYCT